MRRRVHVHGMGTQPSGHRGAAGRQSCSNMGQAGRRQAWRAAGCSNSPMPALLAHRCRQAGVASWAR